jgi:hypothetical protein
MMLKKHSLCNMHLNMLCMYLLAPNQNDFSLRVSRMRRAAGPPPTTILPGNGSGYGNASEFVPTEANFSIIFTTTGCLTWNDDNNSWTMDGCQVTSCHYIWFVLLTSLTINVIVSYELHCITNRINNFSIVNLSHLYSNNKKHRACSLYDHYGNQ